MPALKREMARMTSMSSIARIFLQVGLRRRVAIRKPKHQYHLLSQGAVPQGLDVFGSNEKRYRGR